MPDEKKNLGEPAQKLIIRRVDATSLAWVVIHLGNREGLTNMSSAVTKAAPLSSKRKKDDDDDDEHDDDNDKPVVIGDGNEEASLESDDDEDDEQQQQAPRQDGKQGAQGDFAKLGRLFERQRVDFAKTFTKDCMTVEQVDASRFAQHGVKPSTQCAACDDAIMGNCTNVYVFMHRGGSAVRYFHPDCFCCTHHDQASRSCAAEGGGGDGYLTRSMLGQAMRSISLCAGR